MPKKGKEGTLSTPEDNLHIDEDLEYVASPQPKSGIFKMVYPVMIGNGVLAAAKIYRLQELGTKIPIAREERARDEYAVYQRFMNSPLAKETPPAFRLLHDQGIPAGLLVAWKDGNTFKRMPYFPDRTDFDKLMEKFMSWTSSPWPSTLMVSPDNLSHDSDGKFYFASCRLDSDDPIRAGYQANMTNAFNKLKGQFTTK